MTQIRKDPTVRIEIRIATPSLAEYGTILGTHAELTFAPHHSSGLREKVIREEAMKCFERSLDVYFKYMRGEISPSEEE